MPKSLQGFFSTSVLSGHVLLGSLLQSGVEQFLNTDISQGSVETFKVWLASY